MNTQDCRHTVEHAFCPSCEAWRAEREQREEVRRRDEELRRLDLGERREAFVEAFRAVDWRQVAIRNKTSEAGKQLQAVNAAFARLEGE